MATPPFGHTVEYVLDGFDHELESQRLLAGMTGPNTYADMGVYESQLPKFAETCRRLSRTLKTSISPVEVAQLVIGESELGFLIRGTLDLDNADNVTRACLYLGADVDRNVPIILSRWLADQPHTPTELAETSNRAVAQWLQYRDELYSRFYEASDEEIARQAFLQHLMRMARADGIPRRTLVWSTDESVLNEIAGRNRELASLVQRYRLLESPIRLAKIDLLDDNELRCISTPSAVAWIEQHLSSRGLHAVVSVTSRRFGLPTNAYSLFPAACGALHVFTLSSSVHLSNLPEWIATKLSRNLGQAERIRRISALLGNAVAAWVRERPWLAVTVSRREEVHDNLKHVGDWGFRETRNESFHAYPSTFVHAIPATLINELGLRGELVVDPFGGTGQTAIEAIKYGGTAVSADCNAVACLVASARLTYLPINVRARFRSYGRTQVMGCDPIEVPSFDRADKWFHPRTFKELCRIRRFIQTRRDKVARDFLFACFSAILEQCSSRRGKENSYFADNTPLPKGVEKPTQQDAVDSFLKRIQRNVSSIERLYAVFERDGRNPQAELARVSIRQLDATMAEPHDYGLKPNSVAAIITSPPYLCMSDYTLGQRLSYNWMNDWTMDADFGCELGARRQRLSADKKSVVEEYLLGLERFVERSGALLRPGGYIAIVIGNSMARAFNDVDVPKELDRMLERAGFQILWHHWRQIHWHRAHNLARLKEERISLHLLP